MGSIVAITGARAGVGRATAEEFASQGWDVALLARDPARLEEAAAELSERHGVRTLAVPADVADAEAVEAAAERIEAGLGPIEVWVNVAMATAFAPLADISAAEFRRATEVTYLGQVHGTMAALKRMRQRNRGTIVNVGSALSYRAVPLQAAYCGAKFAVRGFTDAVRCEILHDGLAVHLTMGHLPAVNTPQFDWALNRTGRQARPVPPVFQPEVAARAIYFSATHRRREVWVGFPTVGAILANRIRGCSTAPWRRQATADSSRRSLGGPMRRPTCSSRSGGAGVRTGGSTPLPAAAAWRCSPAGIGQRCWVACSSCCWWGWRRRAGELAEG